MSDKNVPPGPKTKQGLTFVMIGLLFTVLSTTIFTNDPTQTIILVCGAVIAVCGVIVTIQGRKEDTAHP